MLRVLDFIHKIGRWAASPEWFIGTNLIIVLLLLWDHFGPNNLRIAEPDFDVIVSLFTLFLDEIIIIVQWHVTKRAKQDRDEDRLILENIHEGQLIILEAIRNAQLPEANVRPA